MTYVKKFLYFSLLAGGVLFWFFVAIGSITDRKGRVIVYNCELAEISPDFPLQVKEDCRKLKASSKSKITHNI